MARNYVPEISLETTTRFNAGDFSASIAGDDVAYPAISKALTYVDAARFVRHLANAGEIISIYGPIGVRHFKVSGPAKLLVRVRIRQSELNADRTVIRVDASVPA